MINIARKEECCGCSACEQKCPKQCITMRFDNDGFAYPVVNKDICNNCGLCERVCPVINQNKERKPLKTFAAINNNEEIRDQSSSGGIFSLLATKTLNNGGVVFGAAFNNKWEVEHIYIETSDELHKLRSSKYVQSNINRSYKQAEQFLKAGREVLFSGTPCQISGLKLYLRKEYRNLTTVDVVCHGVPSPAVWRQYLQETVNSFEENKGGKNSAPSDTNVGWESCIKSIAFRSKIKGWKKYSFMVHLTFFQKHGKNTVFFQETHSENLFMRCFLRNLCLRPSCYNCPVRKGKSSSDITLADLWGSESICRELDDDKGLSLVLQWNKNTELPACTTKEIQYEEALRHNPAIETNSSKPIRRHLFFKLFRKKGVYHATTACTKETILTAFLEKVIWNIKNRMLK